MNPGDWEEYQAVLRRWRDLPDELRAAREASARSGSQQDQAAQAVQDERLRREREATAAVRAALTGAEGAARGVGLAPTARKALHPSLVGQPPGVLEPVARELADAVCRAAASFRAARALELRIGVVLGCTFLIAACAGGLALAAAW